MGIDEPIIIIAAARSGTKMLRFILSASSEITGYPYDANYLWKHGNYRTNHDELQPDSIDDKKKNKIRSFFIQLCKKDNRPRLLEKSVPNSLRIPFVRSIFPECKIIHLYRNGLDVAADARMCWQDSASSERIQSKQDRIRKLREFPLFMALPYLLEYMKSYGKKMLLKQAHVESWGPRYKGIDQDVQNKSLIEVCAIQWAMCVEHCCFELKRFENGSDYINVSYEELVSEPANQLERIVDFVTLSDGEKVINRGKEVVKPNYMHSWKDYLSGNELDRISGILHRPKRLLDELK
ncbi:MAG: sulfotransferase [Deltaproteobacteria bacterium]|nr:sulfotransferase [Deltaproteobacteria bacterium]